MFTSSQIDTIHMAITALEDHTDLGATTQRDIDAIRTKLVKPLPLRYYIAARGDISYMVKATDSAQVLAIMNENHNVDEDEINLISSADTIKDLIAGLFTYANSADYWERKLAPTGTVVIPKKYFKN